MLLLPPRVGGAADGLGYAVQGFAVGDEESVVFGVIVVAPGGEEEQAPAGA